ncbi:MAG TPA: monofunctional biosynthetic peptidoglycan transglycosylase [Chitinophagaceae bacterium]|nr:monofunctional biosynthetic peptidoglycan transglycosylase [Chitinophagaceae bacterium]
MPLLRKAWKWVRRIFLWLFIAQLLYIVVLKWVNPPITITQLQSWLSGNGLKRDYIGRKSVPYNMKLAVIAAEDQLFADHHGFDWKSIRKAMRYNNRKPGRIRGGSTISQQVAKNVFLWQGRSWVRKALEAYFTFMIELTWGKKRILHVYLNVIETGDGIFGVEEAARKYFKKPASLLTRQEAALIAACLPNPKRLRVSPPSNYISSRSRFIARQMGFIEADPDLQRIIR